MESTDYARFILLPDENYSIDDPRYSDDPNSGFLIVFFLYGAVPLGSSDPSNIVPGKRFLFLGEHYKDYYIERETVLRRLDVETRKQDYEIMLAIPRVTLFDVWNVKGKLTNSGFLLSIKPRNYDSFEAWDKDYHKLWIKICGDIYDAQSSRLSFNVYTRFIEPAQDQISLFFTPVSSPAPAPFTVVNLRRMIQVSNED